MIFKITKRRKGLAKECDDKFKKCANKILPFRTQVGHESADDDRPRDLGHTQGRNKPKQFIPVKLGDQYLQIQ